MFGNRRAEYPGVEAAQGRSHRHWSPEITPAISATPPRPASICRRDRYARQQSCGRASCLGLSYTPNGSWQACVLVVNRSRRNRQRDPASQARRRAPSRDARDDFWSFEQPGGAPPEGRRAARRGAGGGGGGGGGGGMFNCCSADGELTVRFPPAALLFLASGAMLRKPSSRSAPGRHNRPQGPGRRGARRSSVRDHRGCVRAVGGRVPVSANRRRLAA